MKQRQRHIHCKYFNGVIHDRCKAGCAYVPGHIDQCIGRGVDATAPCPKLEYPTPEEIAEKDSEFAAMRDNVAKARAAIVEYARNPAVNPKPMCPVCGSALVYKVHDNGHIHAKCPVGGCVCWME